MPSETNADPTQSPSSPLLDAEGRVIHRAANHAEAPGDQLVDAIRRQPLTAALIIFAAGYLLGKIT